MGMEAPVCMIFRKQTTKQTSKQTDIIVLFTSNYPSTSTSSNFFFSLSFSTQTCMTHSLSLSFFLFSAPPSSFSLLSLCSFCLCSFVLFIEIKLSWMIIRVLASFNHVARTQGWYRLVQLNCQQDLFTVHLDAVAINTGGQYLSVSDIPFISIYKTLAAIMGLLTMVWVASWYCMQTITCFVKFSLMFCCLVTWS